MSTVSIRAGQGFVTGHHDCIVNKLRLRDTVLLLWRVVQSQVKVSLMTVYQLLVHTSRPPNNFIMFGSLWPENRKSRVLQARMTSNGRTLGESLNIACFIMSSSESCCQQYFTFYFHKRDIPLKPHLKLNDFIYNDIYLQAVMS